MDVTSRMSWRCVCLLFLSYIENVFRRLRLLSCIVAALCIAYVGIFQTSKRLKGRADVDENVRNREFPQHLLESGILLRLATSYLLGDVAIFCCWNRFLKKSRSRWAGSWWYFLFSLFAVFEVLDEVHAWREVGVVRLEKLPLVMVGEVEKLGADWKDLWVGLGEMVEGMQMPSSEGFFVEDAEAEQGMMEEDEHSSGTSTTSTSAPASIDEIEAVVKNPSKQNFELLFPFNIGTTASSNTSGNKTNKLARVHSSVLFVLELYYQHLRPEVEAVLQDSWAGSVLLLSSYFKNSFSVFRNHGTPTTYAKAETRGPRRTHDEDPQDPRRGFDHWHWYREEPDAGRYVARPGRFVRGSFFSPKLDDALEELWTQKRIVDRSGFFFYPPGGGCRWHTNAQNVVSYRMYLTFLLNRKTGRREATFPSTLQEQRQQESWSVDGDVDAPGTAESHKESSPQSLQQEVGDNDINPSNNTSSAASSAKHNTSARQHRRAGSFLYFYDHLTHKVRKTYAVTKWNSPHANAP